jgi:hypothetical protein
MIALRRAMRSTPIASVTVITAGRPSGIAATAIETAAKNISPVPPPDERADREGQRGEPDDRDAQLW